MAIEFRCTQCNKLLRTPEGTAGKQARCPECGTISTVPAEGTVPPSQAPPSEPPPPETEPGGPFTPLQPKPAAFDPENPYAAPGEFAPSGPGQVPSPGALGHTIIDVNDVFSRTWAIFKEQWGMCLAIVLLGWIIATAGFLVLLCGPVIVGFVAEDEVLLILGAVAGYILGMVFMSWIMIGIVKAVLGIARGEQPDLAKLFSGMSHVIPVFLTGLLLMLISYGILLVCALPGLLLAAVEEDLGAVVIVLGILVGYVFVFIVMLMFSQAYFLIIDRNVGVIESLKMSKHITQGNRLTLFLLWLVGLVVYIVSLIPCGLGIFVSIPFLALMATVVYLAMTGQPTADQMLPGRPAVK